MDEVTITGLWERVHPDRTPSAVRFMNDADKQPSFFLSTMSYKVIVADASPSVQKVVLMAFPERGFEIYPFEDGNEVLESLERINPDAVLVSLSLAGRDGYDVGSFLKSREEHKKTTLILLRGTFELLDYDRLSGLDYDKIVQKPFDSEALAEAVLEIVDKKKCPATWPEELTLEDPLPADESPGDEGEESAAGAPPKVQTAGTDKPAADNPPHSQASASGPTASFPAALGEADIEAKIKRSVREEILIVERELEKRLRAALSAELKKRLDQEKASIPPKE
jgi:CheY-like chemotaxis protein